MLSRSATIAYADDQAKNFNLHPEEQEKTIPVALLSLIPSDAN